MSKEFAVDKLYYIMDYSSNYYRLSANNQLVAARDEGEATVFSFVEANRRIGAGPKSRFYFMTPVNTGDIENSDYDQEEGDNYKSGENVESVVKYITESERMEAVKNSISEYDASRIDWEEYLSHFAYISSSLTNYRTELVNAESEVDKKICDILHYIELCDMNDDEATDLIELLKVCRENRRDIKDEILRVDAFQKTAFVSILRGIIIRQNRR